MPERNRKAIRCRLNEPDPRDATIAALEDENRRLREALDKIISELGVPQPGYPQPVANAAQIARRARKEG